MAPPVAAEPTPPSFPPTPPPMLAPTPPPLLVPTPKRGGVLAAPTRILLRPRRPAAAAAPPLRGISSVKKLLTPHQDAAPPAQADPDRRAHGRRDPEVAAAVDSAAGLKDSPWDDMGACSDSSADDMDRGGDAFREDAAEDAKDMLYRLTTPLD
eukprot:2599155-Pyramimonas_sp.AAC.1